MSHLDEELKKLKAEITEMWNLVISQLSSAQISLFDCDKETINQVFENEKKVDEFELKINMDCENILALFNPLANDLRFVLSVLKINYNLERLGDYAKSIAKVVKNSEKRFHHKVLDEAKILNMFEVSMEMLKKTLEAFEKENNELAMSIFQKDEKLDQVNKNSNKMIASFIKDNPKDALHFLDLFTIIKRLERVGDQTKNISEEIIFYIEAKQIRHSKIKVEKSQKKKNKKDETK